MPSTNYKQPPGFKEDPARPLCGYDGLTFVQCPGLGDQVCGLNVANNVGAVEGRILPLFYNFKDFLFKGKMVYDCFSFPNIEIRGLESEQKDLKLRDFQPWGSDTSWVRDWNRGALNISFDHERHMVHAKIGDWNFDYGRENRIGMSFSVNSAPLKVPSKILIEAMIDKFLAEGREIIYFGYRKDFSGDEWLSRFDGKVSFPQGPIDHQMLGLLKSCGRFIGADSGVAWLAAFLRMPTTVVMNKRICYDAMSALPEGYKMKTFDGIPWVEVLWDQEYSKKYDTAYELKTFDLERYLERDLIYEKIGQHSHPIRLTRNGLVESKDSLLFEKKWAVSEGELLILNTDNKCIVNLSEEAGSLKGVWTYFDRYKTIVRLP